MPDVEKLVNGLEWALENMVDPTNDFRFAGYDGPCILLNQPIVSDALALLKAHEPRVMTLGEISKALKMPLWKETKSANKYLYTGWALAYDIQKGEGITGTRLGMSEPSGRVVWYMLDDYGKTWRCWTSRPTDEQREKEPWNG